MTKINYSEDSSEVMIVHPSGRVEFMGIWSTMCLVWKLLRAKKQVSLNGEKI